MPALCLVIGFSQTCAPGLALTNQQQAVNELSSDLHDLPHKSVLSYK
jgi:hypothetical protein